MPQRGVSLVSSDQFPVKCHSSRGHMLSRHDIESHAGELRRLALRISPSDGEDLAQQALARAWERRAQFRDGAPVMPWLRTILVRLAVSGARSAAVRRRYYGRYLGEVDLHQSSATPSAVGEVDRGELAERVELALLRLSVEHEALLRMIDLDGGTYKDAADALGLPIGTVMSRLHRARKAAAVELRSVNEMQ